MKLAVKEVGITKFGELCENEANNPHYRQINTPRHTITVDFHQFVKDPKKQLSKMAVSKNLKRYSVPELIKQS